MPEPDNSLIAEFNARRSEDAFAALVRQHVNLVFATALRQVGDAGAAQEITQNVFVALALAAGKLGSHPTIAGWLHQTALNKSREWLRGELRRRKREQIAVNLDLARAEGDSVWSPLVPLLDEALLELREPDRQAVILHYIEGQTFQEVGSALGMGEDAARKRVNRCLDQLTHFFRRRGFAVPALAAGAPLFTLSSHAAPAGLAASATTAGLAAAHSAASTSTLTLIKGALKIMAWTKAKTAVVTAVVVLFTAGTATVVVEKVANANSVKQRLPDGSVLAINQISYGDKHDIVVGKKTNHWSSPGHDELIVELKLSGKLAGNNPLVKTAFYRQFRGVLHGERGIEYVQEIYPDRLTKTGGDYFGQIQTEIVPRDSRELWLRIEEAETNRPYGNWKTIAQFNFPNPAPASNYNWMASATPVSNTVDGMNFVLKEVILKTNLTDPRDIWNHKTSIPTEVWANGVQLTNWAPVYIAAADVSGNHVSYFQTHRSLDPRYVWKMEMDFEPQSDFKAENMATVSLPRPRSKITAEVMGQPVTISWDGTWIRADMPTNRPDLALKFVSATDAQGNEMLNPSGNWNQHGFQEGNFMVRRDGVMSMVDVRPTKLTFAVVPNIHTTFYVQPRLVVEKAK